MPVTDLLTRVTDSTTGRPVISALAAPKAIGAATASLTDVTNWTTSSAIHFVIYETTASGIKDPTTQTDWKGTLSGTTVSNLTLTGGTDRAYSTGAKVELTPTARFAKDLYDNLSAHANQDGTLKTSAVQAALNIAATSTDWTPLANTLTMVSSNGQREHVLQATGVNYTDRLQAGTKLQIPRTGTTPTTSMAFVSASSQYASKTSPTGITFTDDFTCEAWVYLDSYSSGLQSIVSRIGASSGWQINIQSTGQIEIDGYNGGYGNSRQAKSYQSIPLGKWVHIAASLDMSGFTTATCKIFIDGVDVPVALTSIGTNPTSLIQEGNLELAAYNGANNPLNGKIANARVWSTIRTAAQIRDNMNQETPASTTGLVAHFKGNGSWNDSSSNANHLTAVGGAVNNSATHPYSATEYAIVTKTEYTGGNTAVTVFTGSNCLPNETLGTASYSGLRVPYGFPADESDWRIEAIYRTTTEQTSPTVSIWYNVGGRQIQVPSGKWRIGYENHISCYKVSTTAITVRQTLSTSTSAETNQKLTSGAGIEGATGTLAAQATLSREDRASITTLTTYYGLLVASQSGFGALYFDNSINSGIYYAECAYL